MITTADKLISATRLVNHIRNDPIIDYLDLLNSKNLSVNENLKIINKEETFTQNKRQKTSFDYITEEGYKFEDKIITKIKKYMNDNFMSNKIIEIQKDEDIIKHYEKTKNTIQKYFYDVILGGILINTKNDTYGYPDLIVSGKWIQNFFAEPPIKFINKQTYYIIDIKSSTIKLIKGGKFVASGNLYIGYKTQIWVYKEALNQIQNCESNYGFILGKKYNYVSDRTMHTINNSFQMLGIIDYNTEINDDFKNKIKKSIKWNKELRTNWNKYKLYPITRKIMPNMKNAFDKNHKKVKKIIAQKNKDISLLWNCGIKQRNYALKHKIIKYDDKKLTAEKLGFVKNTFKNKIINSMLNLSRSSNKIIDMDKKSNYNNWKNPTKYEFFVDFETYPTTFDEINIIQNENIENIENIENEYIHKIYMIGISHYDIENKEYKFKCFIIDYKNCEEIYKDIEKRYNINKNDIIITKDEKTLIKTFIEYIYSFKNLKEPKYKFLRNVRLIHWSVAEPSLFLKKLTDYNINTINNTLPWYDLMEIFKNPEYPILIKNCFSFSLKETIKTLNMHKLINLEWSDLDDGLLSTFIAKEIYKENHKDNSAQNNKNMENIIEYNFIDCKALYTIINFLRKF
jgi:hypothetical protein